MYAVTCRVVVTNKDNVVSRVVTPDMRVLIAPTHPAPGPDDPKLFWITGFGEVTPCYAFGNVGGGLHTITDEEIKLAKGIPVSEFELYFG